MTEWMPAILALFGSLLVVLFSAWLNTRALSVQLEAMDKKLSSQIDALEQKSAARMEVIRAEMQQGFAELRLEFHKEISELVRRVERLEERPGLVRA